MFVALVRSIELNWNWIGFLCKCARRERFGLSIFGDRRRRRWIRFAGGRGLWSSLCSLSPSSLLSSSSLTGSNFSLPTVTKKKKKKISQFRLTQSSLRVPSALFPFLCFNWLVAFLWISFSGRREFLDDLSSVVRILLLKPDQFIYLIFLIFIYWNCVCSSSYLVARKENEFRGNIVKEIFFIEFWFRLF